MKPYSRPQACGGGFPLEGLHDWGPAEIWGPRKWGLALADAPQSWLTAVGGGGMRPESGVGLTLLAANGANNGNGGNYSSESSIGSVHNARMWEIALPFCTYHRLHSAKEKQPLTYLTKIPNRAQAVYNPHIYLLRRIINIMLIPSRQRA